MNPRMKIRKNIRREKRAKIEETKKQKHLKRGKKSVKKELLKIIISSKN